MTSRPASVMTAVSALLGLFLAAPARAADQPRPNVLFVIADDWSYGHAGVHGCTWVKTPAFDRVAREGVLFQHCFTNNPKCSPCRASILTGRNTWQLEEACCHNGIFRAKWAVYPDLLEKAGYSVGYTGKGWGPGDFKAGGFTRNPAGPDFNQYKSKPAIQGISPVDYARNFAGLPRANANPASRSVSGTAATSRTASTSPEPECVPERSWRTSYCRPISQTRPVVRSDFLDYAMEVEWFDSHLGRILKALEDAKELDNTLIVVTSDHGCPFPRVKGQIYEHGFHIPLAIRWGRQIKAGRTVNDFINVRDFAPTFLEVAGVQAPASVSGKSFADVLRSPESGWVDRTRNRMVIGKERHDIGRPNDWGYPVRAIRTPEYLYVRNYEPDRWPVGNPETGYRNCDDGPTKELILSSFNRYYKLCFGKRPAEELYRVDKDPDCVKDLAAEPASARIMAELRKEMEESLRKDQDPRILGNGAVFDTYKYVSPRKHAYDTWLKNQ